MNEIIISDIEPIDFSPRWGSKWSTWGEVNEPKTTIQFYAPQSGKATIAVKNEEGKELWDLSVDATKGINVVDYDLSISEKGSKVFDKSETKVKKAENGKYYLPKGKHRITVAIFGKTATSDFEVK